MDEGKGFCRYTFQLEKHGSGFLELRKYGCDLFRWWGYGRSIFGRGVQECNLFQQGEYGRVFYSGNGGGNIFGITWKSHSNTFDCIFD